MNKKELLLGVACMAATGVPQAHAANGEKPRDGRPNVLIIYTDDMGIGDISSFNNGWILTPNLSAFAAQSLQFQHYYSAASVSSPSRVGLTTGQFPLNWGINTYLQTIAGDKEWHQFDYLDSKAPSMARAFRDSGYATGHFGKWHMGGGRDVDDAPGIPEYGFDEYNSTWESPDPDPRITASDWIWSEKDEIKRWERTAYFIDKTLDFLSRHKDTPCFVNLWPDDMHTPWVPSAELQSKKATFNSEFNFHAVLMEYDRQMGRLIQGLKDIGQFENTIIIFTSDNGPAPSFHQKRTNGLRGQKCSLYEGGINMPFFIHWEGHIPAGHNYDSVVCSVDLFPSLCAMAGVPLPEGYVSSGEDMSVQLLGRSHEDRKGDLMWEYGQNRKNIQAPDQANKHNMSPHLAIRRGKMKLLANCDGTDMELYNLDADPYETNNIVEKRKELADSLFQEVLAWWNRRAIRE